LTDQDAPVSGWRTVATTDGTMRIYQAHPNVPTDRAVVILQEAFGVNDHIQEITRRCAARGFLALAPDLFHRTGVAELSYDQRTEAMSLIDAISQGQIITDVHAVLEHLRTGEGIEPDRTAIIGFCFGGRAAFTAATATAGLAAAVVFYGPGIAAGPHAVLDRAGAITAPMLLHVGSEDPAIPAERVMKIDSALTAARVDFEQHVYPGAGHAFACDARPSLFRRQDAEVAWERTYAFLDKHLCRSPDTRAAPKTATR
jgi:carboxymethylenebutenolidase